MMDADLANCLPSEEQPYILPSLLVLITLFAGSSLIINIYIKCAVDPDPQESLPSHTNNMLIFISLATENFNSTNFFLQKEENSFT